MVLHITLPYSHTGKNTSDGLALTCSNSWALLVGIAVPTLGFFVQSTVLRTKHLSLYSCFFPLVLDPGIDCFLHTCPIIVTPCIHFRLLIPATYMVSSIKKKAQHSTPCYKMQV